MCISGLTCVSALSLGYKIHDTRVICNDEVVDRIRFAISSELNISSSDVSISCNGFVGNLQTTF